MCLNGAIFFFKQHLAIPIFKHIENMFLYIYKYVYYVFKI